MIPLEDICIFKDCEQLLSNYISNNNKRLVDVAMNEQCVDDDKLNPESRKRLLLYAMYKLHFEQKYLGAVGLLAWTLRRYGFSENAIKFLENELEQELKEDIDFGLDHAGFDLCVMLAQDSRFVDALAVLNKLTPDDSCFDASIFYTIKGWCLNGLGKICESLKAFECAKDLSRDEEERKVLEQAIPDKISNLRVDSFGNICRIAGGTDDKEQNK
jgi:tetratricopeptide (TPR) repeat protein